MSHMRSVFSILSGAGLAAPRVLVTTTCITMTTARSGGDLE